MEIRPAKICFAAYTIDSIAVGNGGGENEKKCKLNPNKQEDDKPKNDRTDDFLFFKRYFPEHIKAVINGTVGVVPTEGKRLARIAEKYQGDREFISIMKALCIDISKYMNSSTCKAARK